ATAGSTILRQTEVHERMRLSAARNPAQPARATQASIAARLPSLRAISALRPPIDCAQVRPSIASSTQSIDGVLIVSPLNTPSISLPPWVRRKILGSGHGGVYVVNRSTARGL